MRFLIPIISAIFFRASGWGKDDYFAPIIPLKMPQNRLLQLIIGKLREIGIGLLVFSLTGQFWAFPAYFVATSLSYGSNENNWLRKLVGRDINWLIYGGLFGLSSYFSLSLGLCLIQSLLGAGSFWFLMKWSNNGLSCCPSDDWKLDHSYVELGFGCLGTIIYLWR